MPLRALAAVLAVLVTGATLALTPGVAAADDSTYRRLRFPVEGTVTYGNDWGAPRSGGRTHAGNDLMGRKLQPLLAARAGTIRLARVDSGTNAGNMITIEDGEGWEYWYLHVNNDAPGTDDGTNPPEFRFAPGMASGVAVQEGQVVAYLGDSGNAEGTAPHLHFELHRPDGAAVNPFYSLMLSQGRKVNDRCRPDDNPSVDRTAASGLGYWSLASDGGIFSFGDARFFGSMGGRHLNRPVMALTPTLGAQGYWLVASDGGIFSFGDALFHGSTGGIALNQPIVGMARTASGLGYWLVASDGGIFSFGDARFYGSTGGIALNSPIVGMTTTRSGLGYWLVASDGGIFSFGDATFHGSTGGVPVGPVTGMATTPSGTGYWLQTAGGRTFAFGDAIWTGDVATIGVCTVPRVVRLVPGRSGRGYWQQTADGRVWPFGDVLDWGDVVSQAVRTSTMLDLAASR